MQHDASGRISAVTINLGQLELLGQIRLCIIDPASTVSGGGEPHSFGGNFFMIIVHIVLDSGQPASR